MPEKDPLSYQIATYAWVIGLSAWGGLASYCRKVKLGIITKPSFAEFIGELVISGFVGTVTFFLCQAGEINQLFSAAFIGIASHMGSRAILLFEKSLQAKAENYLKK